MEPRHVEFRRGRVGIEKLEPRIAPAIVAVNPGGNTPQGRGGEDVLIGDNASLDRSGSTAAIDAVMSEWTRSDD